MDRKTLISVVFPVFNEEENLQVLYAQVQEALLQTKVDYELIFVDNGCTDSSLTLIKDFAAKDSSVQYLSLSRNFGHQGGILAGLHHCSGDAVITMDADLQHPPKLISEMIALWKEGFEVVYTTKKNYKTKWWRSLQVKVFYWLLSRLSALKLSFGQSDFRLLDRKVIDAINKMPEYRKFLRGLVQWIGFRQVGLEYAVEPRYAGKSKFSYRSLLSFASDGIFAFSFIPLRWSLVMGVMVAALCFFYALYASVLGVLHLYFGGLDLPMPPGWATLTAAVMFLASIQLIAIGLLSEYVGRIYEQTKGRPSFVIRESSKKRSVHDDDHYPLWRKRDSVETIDRRAP